VESSSRQLGYLGVHQFLGQQPHAIAEEAGVGALLILVE